MSEQTPPPNTPTPPPSEGTGTGAAPGAGEGTPPPPPPAGASPAGGAVPPPPEKKKRTGLIAAIVAAVVVLALIVAAVIVFAVVKPFSEDKHAIAITKTAGGMKRDTAKEAQLKQQLDAAEQQFKSQAKSVTYVKSGVYDQADTKRGPKGALVFLGAKLSKVQSPTKFVSSFSKQAGSNGFKIDKVAPGDGGGKAVCAYATQGQKVAICAWATKDTIGELVPTVPGYDSKQLSKILVSLRSDVETTE